MEHQLKPFLLAIGGVLFCLFVWHLIFLQQCQNWNAMGVLGAFQFLWHNCPNPGPYGPNSDNIIVLILYALTHPGR
jgi:hypothetical protein